MGRNGVSWWDDHASLRPVLSAKRPGDMPALCLRRRQASRLSGGEAAGGPGPSRPGVCGDPAGASDAGAGGSMLGAVRDHRRVQPGPGPCRAGPRRTALLGSWQTRAPTLTGWPPRACAGIGGRSSAWRTSEPPGELKAGAPSDAGTAQAAARVPTTRTGGVCRAQPRASRVTTHGSRCRGNDGLPRMDRILCVVQGL